MTNPRRSQLGPLPGAAWVAPERGGTGQSADQVVEQRRCDHSARHRRERVGDTRRIGPGDRCHGSDHPEDQYARRADPSEPDGHQAQHDGQRGQRGEDPQLQYQLSSSPKWRIAQSFTGVGVRSIAAPPTAVIGPASGRTATETNSATAGAANPASSPLSAPSGRRTKSRGEVVTGRSEHGDVLRVVEGVDQSGLPDRGRQGRELRVVRRGGGHRVCSPFPRPSRERLSAPSRWS